MYFERPPTLKPLHQLTPHPCWCSLLRLVHRFFIGFYLFAALPSVYCDNGYCFSFVCHRVPLSPNIDPTLRCWDRAFGKHTSCFHRILAHRLHLSGSRSGIPRGDKKDELGSQISSDCLRNSKRPDIVVVGKIIVDEYGNPDQGKRLDSSGSASFTIGGGGPQAAWGAAAAVAVRDYFSASTGEKTSTSPGTTLPPKQPVTFLAPIGLKNWSPEMARALDAILLPVLKTPPILVPSKDHITPCISIWHDENERVNWRPLDGSFEEKGADGLWRNRPNAQIILDALPNLREDDSRGIVLHSIVEAGHNPPGQGLDALPLFNATLLDHVVALGIEPIVFPEEECGKVSLDNAMSVVSLISKVEKSLALSSLPNSLLKNDLEAQMNRKLLLISPDQLCHDSILPLLESDASSESNEPSDTSKTHNHHGEKFSSQSLTSKEMAVRDGANGSFTNEFFIPSATLRTVDGAPVNPTGAGNAYAAAFVACRGTGSSVKESAILATAVGAVVCEHDHLPIWSWEVLQRISDAALEVRGKVSAK